MSYGMNGPMQLRQVLLDFLEARKNITKTVMETVKRLPEDAPERVRAIAYHDAEIWAPKELKKFLASRKPCS